MVVVMGNEVPQKMHHIRGQHSDLPNLFPTLQYLEHLRQVVGLRGYASKDPLEEFKREAFKLFESLLNKIKIDFITFLNNLEIVTEEAPIKNQNNLKREISNNPKCLLVIKKSEKIPRNEKCPATGKKYKHCCGAL